MVNTRYLQCPACLRLFRAWHQVGATDVMCPCCGATVTVESQIPETPPESQPAAGFIDFLVATLHLQFLMGQ